MIHTGVKLIHFKHRKQGLYCHNFTPGKLSITMLHTVDATTKGFTNRQVHNEKNSRTAYNLVGRPYPQNSENMVRGNMIRNCPVTVGNVKNSHTIYGPNAGSLLLKSSRSQVSQ